MDTVEDRTNHSQTILLIAIAVCGGFMIVLSFMNWVDFDAIRPIVLGGQFPDLSFMLNGTDLSRFQGAVDLADAAEQGGNACTCRATFGDGYLTAILGAIVLIAASSAVLVRSRKPALTVVAVLGSLAAVVIGGYNATGIWEGLGTAPDTGGFFLSLDGDVTIELYTLTAIAALSAVLGAVILMTAARDALERTVEEIEAEDPEVEDAGEWA